MAQPTAGNRPNTERAVDTQESNAGAPLLHNPQVALAQRRLDVREEPSRSEEDGGVPRHPHDPRRRIGMR